MLINCNQITDATNTPSKLLEYISELIAAPTLNDGLLEYLLNHLENNLLSHLEYLAIYIDELQEDLKNRKKEKVLYMQLYGKVKKVFNNAKCA
ncbi:hypothetical protein GCM10010995_05840 [Cysteiniphilum litorale]|uniref:Uncharacterized protein n=1 Tax=Cysteiniphilum litorale TaxID=2056700 RepID=A0A8J2Z321_9GAMM|nr:hypothetical protein GCM10010995_05840 [Cysteiniphilum litorale]